MTHVNDNSWTKAEINGLTKAIPFLLAGLEGGLNEFELQSFTLQRSDTAAFRCILRGHRVGGSTDGVRLVAFTNAELASECILYAESGFASDAIRWHIDIYAKGVSSNGDSKTGRQGLTLRK